MIIATQDRTRRLDANRAVEYEAAQAYAERAEARGLVEVDPIVRSLLLGVAMGRTVTELACWLEIPRRTAASMVERAMR